MHEFIDAFVIQYVINASGSIEAKLGVGLLMAQKLPLIKSQSQLNLMKVLKTQIDPHGIMNPYKII